MMIDLDTQERQAIIFGLKRELDDAHRFGTIRYTSTIQQVLHKLDPAVFGEQHEPECECSPCQDERLERLAMHGECDAERAYDTMRKAE